jgi:hypothetical protein
MESGIKICVVNFPYCPQALVELHGGEVPDTFEELEQLSGVGHKTASVVMSVAFQVISPPHSLVNVPFTWHAFVGPIHYLIIVRNMVVS